MTTGSVPSEPQEMHLRLVDQHCFARAVGQGQALLVLVTDRATAEGKAWAQLKWAVPGVETLLAGVSAPQP